MLRKYYDYHYNKKEVYKKNPLLQGVVALVSILLSVFAFKSSVLDANNIPSGSMQPTLMIGDFLFVNKMRFTFDIPFTDITLWRIDKPRRGDIITFTPPLDSPLHGKTLVKRVVGVPGDNVEVKDDEVYVNGVHYPVEKVKDEELLLDLDVAPDTVEYLDLYTETIIDPVTEEKIKDHYIIKNTIKTFDRMSNPERTWQIPEGKYMVMGDNRDNSDDSRGCSLIAGSINRMKCVEGDYSGSEGQWGLIDLKNIHGKVFLSYLSVNWGTSGGDNGGNPIVNLVNWVRGYYPGAYIRYDRIFKRIY